jgi:hypothetical protein
VKFGHQQAVALRKSPSGREFQKGLQANAFRRAAALKIETTGHAQPFKKIAIHVKNSLHEIKSILIFQKI